MGESILNITKEVLDRLSIPYKKITIEELGAHSLFSIETEHSALLIGARGEHLKALNFIVKRLAEKKLADPANFIIDVNGYHKRRIESIAGKAKLLAERARAFKHDVEMEPMSAYERMIVHAAFSDDPSITTESEGEGKFRHVVFKYIEGASGDEGEKKDYSSSSSRFSI
ncbi:MAG: R3H domain-containing nucleic acid-binding protein [Candidatus Paceibacterota bacterium]